MILIPEQVRILREEIVNLKIRKDALDRFFRDDERNVSDGSFINYMIDNIDKNEYSSINNKLYQYQNALEVGELLKERNSDSIYYGTKFNVKFDDDNCEETYTLTENSIGLSSTSFEGFVSKDSICGQSLMGKKVGDYFGYRISSGALVSGRVTKIFSNNSYDVHYIKDRAKSCRIANKMKEYREKLYQDNDIVTLKKFNAITLSQFHLLKEESNRLALALSRVKSFNMHNIEISNEDYLYTSSMPLYTKCGIINRFLKDASFVNPVTQDRVEAGSGVSLKLDKNGVITEKRVEVINQAMSTELNTDYIELISPLGLAIMNKKNGDTFTYRDCDRKYVNGMVYDIDNNPNQLRVNDPKKYMKLKKRI